MEVYIVFWTGSASGFFGIFNSETCEQMSNCSINMFEQKIRSENISKATFVTYEELNELRKKMGIKTKPTITDYGNIISTDYLKYLESQKSEDGEKTITKKVIYDDGDGIRKFRCYNIEYYIGSETADEIIKSDLQLEDEDFDETFFDGFIIAKTNQLKRTIPEVIIEVQGEIEDDEIEDLLGDEISEATGWLHDGFDFEEITENPKEN